MHAGKTLSSHHISARSGISRIPMSLGDPQVVRVSAQMPQKFSAMADFSLWIQRFEIYLSEAEMPAEKRARELVSLLDDGPSALLRS